MDLMELIAAAGGKDSIEKMAGSLGLDQAGAADLIGALSPALSKGLQKQGQASGGLDVLQDVLKSGAHQKYLDQPDLMQTESTRDDGNKILGHLFGDKKVSREVAAQAAQKTGLDSDLIKSALPMIAGLAMAALSKKSTDKAESGGLGDLLGGLTGGDDGGLDDLIGLAKKLF